MNTRSEQIREKVNQLIEEGREILHNEANVASEDAKNAAHNQSQTTNQSNNPTIVAYQSWYTKALPVMRQLLPERYAEFQEQYHRNKRKEGEINVLTYTISDYLIGFTLQNPWGKSAFDIHILFHQKFQHQIAILKSAVERVEYVLNDISGILQAELFDTELEAASELLKKGHLRAAGTLAGVTLERHLAKVADNHQIKLSKKDPSVADWNNALKQQSVYDVPDWRFIERLGDIRNYCAHNKDREPTKDEVSEMISGVQKIIKTIF